MPLEGGQDGGDGVVRRCHLPRRRRVVVARPLVANGRRRHDDVTESELRNEHAGAADRHECSAAEGDQLVQPPGRQRRADAGLGDRQASPAVVDLVDRMRAHLGRERPDLATAELGDGRRDHVPKEAENGVPRHVERRVGERRLDHGQWRRIELEDRSVGEVGQWTSWSHAAGGGSTPRSSSPDVASARPGAFRRPRQDHGRGDRAARATARPDARPGSGRARLTVTSRRKRNSALVAAPRPAIRATDGVRSCQMLAERSLRHVAGARASPEPLQEARDPVTGAAGQAPDQPPPRRGTARP